MTSEIKTIMYPCTGTQDRLGFGYPEGHKYLVYDNGEEHYLSHEEAVKKYGEGNVEIHQTDGTICPDCCDIAVALSKLRRHGIDVVGMLEALKSQKV